MDRDSNIIVILIYFLKESERSELLVEKEKETNKYKLDTAPYFKNEDTKHARDIDKSGLVSKIRAIDPQMTFMVICYSEINDLKFLLEGYGLFSVMKMNRDINILSNGHFLTMNDAQKKFIQTMAHDDHINKDVILTGPVGSGKTLLGLEAINIKKSHYKKKHGISPSDFQNQLRVIIWIGNSKAGCQLIQKLEMAKSHNDCSLEIKPSPTYPNSKKLTRIFQGNKSYKSYLCTLIMIDEITR